MNINLEIVTLEEKEKLKKLLQLYLHDLSLYFSLPFNSVICEYNYNIDKYFGDNYAYFMYIFTFICIKITFLKVFSFYYCINIKNGV